jgi:hypothetical protein
MAIRTELSLRLPNSPGALAQVCAALGDERVRVLALHLESSGVLRLIVDNPVRAAGVLRERRHDVSEKEVAVIVISNAPGSLAAVLSLVRDAGVNIEYAYAATSSETASTAFAVLGVDDAIRAGSAAGI